MNTKATILALGLYSISLCAIAKVTPKVYIDGYFFKEMPEKLPAKASISMIDDGNGNTILGIKYPDGTELSEEAKKHAIPFDDVHNAQIIIDKLNDLDTMYTLTKQARQSGSTIKVGDKFPAFKAEDIDGRVWTENDIKGKVMVLNLWFSGCGPCRAEMPELSTWKDKYPQVLFFSSSFHDAETTRKITSQHNFNWIHLINDETFLAWLDGKGYPMTIITDHNGIIRHIENGTTPVQREKLLDTIARLVKE